MEDMKYQECDDTMKPLSEVSNSRDGEEVENGLAYFFTLKTNPIESQTAEMCARAFCVAACSSSGCY